MKSRLAGATKGHGLLKKKADALQMRFRLILGKIIEVGNAPSLSLSLSSLISLSFSLVCRPKW